MFLGLNFFFDLSFFWWDCCRQLLTLEVPILEDVLSTMVSDQVISCKIDRPSGIVSFKKAKSADGLLDEWSSDVTNLLGLVEQTCYLIQREQMIFDTKK